ncbi:MAG: nicotinamide mononucleotide transporter family protein [Kineosporiaceae bacterium]
MSWFQQAFEAQLVIGGHAITYREIIGNGFGLASAIGGMRRKVWAWPVGIVGNVLLFTVFLGVAFGNPQGATLYGQASRQIFFILASVYGWYRWQRTKNTPGSGGIAVHPRWATGVERAWYLSVSLLGVAVCYVIFKAVGAGFPAAWWYYLADSWIFVGSMLATFAMARGWVDFWLCWIAVDLVGVPELLHFEFYPSAVMYGIYGGFVIWGCFVWLRVSREERLTGLADPAVEAVA